MLTNPVKNDLVQSSRTKTVGKIIEVNNRWGWVLVVFPNHERRFNITDQNCVQSLTRLTATERADYYLSLENNGMTDFWRD